MAGFDLPVGYGVVLVYSGELVFARVIKLENAVPRRAAAQHPIYQVTILRWLYLLLKCQLSLWSTVKEGRCCQRTQTLRCHFQN